MLDDVELIFVRNLAPPLPFAEKGGGSEEVCGDGLIDEGCQITPSTPNWDDLTISAFGNSNNGEWFGISTPGIASARLYNTAYDTSNNTGTAEYVVLDNFTYAKSVPEPSTLALLVLGLAGIGVRRRVASVEG